MTSLQVESEPLPELRPELRLMRGAPDAQGQPTWLIHDPMNNRFTQIDVPAYQVLRHWNSCDTALSLINTVNASGQVHIDSKSIAQITDFLFAHELTVAPRDGNWRRLHNTRTARTQGLAARLAHNYLFFRLPLCCPQTFLERTFPVVSRLWSRPARLIIGICGVAGLYLTSRQWDTFLHTVQNYLTWEGVLLSLLALVLVKTAHELGHAYAAVAFGCRVHTMGIAFMVMAPMPYTDVTDAWRLTDRRQRQLIDSAGMLTELAIAAVALFLWAFLPHGTLRSTAFVLSVVSILSSLAININPFMRFDGYYLLAEALRIDNLQSRAFSLGCWKLREWLFGFGWPCPEDLPPRCVAFLIAYAWCVWVYRLLLFVGIALLVYHYFFKVLGIVLFAVEILYFVARPMAAELATWYSMRHHVRLSPRPLMIGLALAVGILLCIIPWSTCVEIPAIAESAQLRMIYPTRSAKVAAVHVKHGARVKAGDPIATLTSSEIEDELTRTRLSLRAALLQHGRRLSDMIDRERSLVLASAIDALRARIADLERERAELEIVAPFDGTVVDLNPELHAGRWISPRDQLTVVSAGGEIVARGYASGEGVQRLSLGAAGVFIPEHPARQKFPIQVDRIATAGATHIEIADLASVNTGRIAVTLDERRRLVPETAQYLITMSALGSVPPNDLSVRGVVLAEGRAESLVARAWRRALSVLVRESGA